ncbi:PAS domain-containing protein (plasmid) [Microvirga terrae]|uniref:histidine kinase n=1 Tax=Microvirga terrae TaxID=2740529 RepID=A0ABY5S2H4_9HYPH|nr:PAS domain-containing sensor histidine kinase [Microvirga terrae]UVF22716.1 PAS domain-containing protein [Microvirga terrae]
MTTVSYSSSEAGPDIMCTLQMIESMPGHAWSADATGRFTCFSRNTLDFLGHAPDDLNSTEDDEFGWRPAVHPEDYERVTARWRHCLETGDAYETEHRLRRADGDYCWVRSSGLPSRDSQGRIVQWYGTIIEIEDQKRAEKALRDRERELSQLVDMVPSHVWRLTPDGEPTFFNKRMVDYLGLDVADTDKPGMSRLDAVIETVHPEDAAKFRATLHRSLVTGESFALRYRLRRADGVYRWMSSRAEPLRDQEGYIIEWYGLCHDIDDQMHADEALRQSERQLQQMIDAVPAVIWCTSPEGIPCYLNKRATDVTGLTLNDLIAPDGSRYLTVVHPDDRDAVEQALGRAIATGTSFVRKYRQRRSDGRHRWVESRAEPLRDDSGKIIQWYGVSVDIDDLVTAQEALRDRERELSQLVDMVPVHIRRLTPEGEPTFFNKRLLDFFGLQSPAELDKPGMSRLAAAIKTLVHPDDSDRLLATVRHSVATGEPYTMKYRMLHADGAYRWVDGRAEPVRNQSGAIVQWYVISLDIDDEMRAQESLRERERELSQLVDMVPSLLWRLSPEGEPTFFSKRLIEFTGLDVGDFDKPGTTRLAAAIATLFHPDDIAKLEQALTRSLTTGESFSLTYRLRHADGGYHWMSGRAEPLRDESGRIVQWYGLSHDIDDQVRIEEALRESERQLQQLIDTVPVQIWCVTPTGEPAYINKTMVDYIGLKLDDFDAQGGLPNAIKTIVHPDDRATLQQALTHCFSTGESFALKFRHRRWDGSFRWQEGHADPLRDENGRIIRWYGANVDIHDFVIAQEALRERERSLWQLVETLPAMIDCAAPDGEPIYRSQQLREFLGYNLEELDGTGKSRLAGTLEAGVHPDDLAGVLENYAHSLSTGEPYRRRHRLRRFDGEYRWVETRAAPMRNAEGAIVQWNVICLDIDGEVRVQEELRLARESLARASQAASLAELSAAIAHEVNQPLAAIVTNSNACQRWLSATPPNLERAQKTVDRIIYNANSAANVVSRIRALFKQSVKMRTSTELSAVVAEVRNLMAEEAARRRVRMDVAVDSHLPPVAVDRVQVQQVLVNLIRNGMEAMDSFVGDRAIGIRVRRVGDEVQTEISDRGRGIEFPERVFEPFFTTKEHGMGMGLAICRSIVEAHGGRLWAGSNEPQGATFTFTLPIEATTAPDR